MVTSYAQEALPGLAISGQAAHSIEWRRAPNDISSGHEAYNLPAPEVAEHLQDMDCELQDS